MGQFTCNKMFVSHTNIRDPELPACGHTASDQQGLGTVQVVTKLKCFGSDCIAQEKDVGPKMGSAD